MAMAFDLTSSLRLGQEHPQLLTGVSDLRHAPDVYQPDSHHLRYAARIVAVTSC